MLNQPDIERWNSQIEKMQDEVAKLGGRLQKIQVLGDVATTEFDADGSFSMQSCADLNPQRKALLKEIFDLGVRAGVWSGDSWYFLEQGVNEGDSPPCDC